MLRIRRYRAFLVFAVVFILAFFHFARSRDWASAVFDEPPSVDHPEPFAPNPAAGSKDAAPPPHGFQPEIPFEGSSDVKQTPTTHEASSSGDYDPFEDAPTVSSPPIPPSDDRIGLVDPAGGDTTSEKKKKPGSLDSDFGAEGQGRLEVNLPEADRPAPHWKKLPEHFPLAPEDIIKLPTGQSKPIPKLQATFKDESSSEKLERLQKLAAVKEAFEHAWTGYKTSAMGHDEVMPVKGAYRDPFNGWGATLVDALDTLWIMDLKEDFSAAVDEVKKIDFTTSDRKDIPLFETVIRYLGGLLGAYDVSGHKHTVLLDKAVELAEILIGAFDTPNRMPMTFYRWAPDYVSQPHRADARVVLAEIGSLSLEFTRLAQLTKQDKYYDAIARITNELEKLQSNTKLPGLWPLKIDASGCRKFKTQDGYELDLNELPLSTPSLGKPDRRPTDIESYKKFGERSDDSGLLEDTQPANYDRLPNETQGSEISDTEAHHSRSASEKDCKEGLNASLTDLDTFGLGALADSTYEYLPKEYMLLGGLKEQYRTMYEKSMDTARKYLLFRPMVDDDRDVRFLATVALSKPFVDVGMNGMRYQYEGTHLTCFAGGMFAVGSKVFGIESDMETAAKLTDGCVWAYESTSTGIMPEAFHLLPCENPESCSWNETRYWKALDPDEEGRIERANRAYEQRVKWAEQAQKELEEAGTILPSGVPSIPIPGLRGSVVKRVAVPVEAQNKETPTPTPTTKGDGITHRNAALPERPSVLSHEDFVQARIRDERIPSGFVDIKSRTYLLRPEAIESVFIMYRLTGDNSWREKGWKMFQAVSKYTRTELANSAISDVTAETPRHKDVMESFWLAETLKYFYLLFSDPTVVSLDEYVLNTEAHPFKRPGY